MPRSLSKTAERTILTAIQDVVGHVQEGLSPTDAVIKVAQDHGLNRDFVQLVCTGYNTGATNHQREVETGVLRKFADFPIADADKAAAVLWPAKVETEAEKHAKTVVSSEYDRAPKAVYRPSVVLQKAASVSFRTEVPPLQPAVTNVDRILRQKRALQEHTEQLRKNASDAQNNLLSKLSQFADLFKAGNFVRAQLKYALHEVHGDAGDSLWKYAQVRNKLREPDMESFRRNGAATPIDWNKPVFKAARECLNATRQAVSARTAYLQGKEANTAQIERLMSPFVPEPKSPGKQASLVGPLVGGALARGIYDSVAKEPAKTVEESIDSMTGRLGDPDHENELRRIQAQTMLSDLMSNDEIISGYDPEEVLRAYNEVSQLSPRSAVLPALVRPWLRKRLTQGAVEPFEAAEMANVEKTISQTQNPKVANVLDTRHLVVR